MNKICYITSIPITIEAFFTEQLKYLSENNFEVYVICSPSTTLQDRLGKQIKFIPVKITRGISFFNILYDICKLVCIFKKEKFQIIQYSTPNAAFIGAIASKLAGIKIRNYHLMGLRYEGFYGIKRKLFMALERFTCLLSTDIECVSNSVQKIAVRDRVFPERKSVVVWNGSTGGINLTRFDASKRDEWRKEIRKFHSIKDDEFVFGFVGRITRDKGVNELLEAFLSFPSPAKLFLIGTPEGTKTLNQELYNNAKNNKSIILIEHITEIEKYYAAMDILILPSYREGFGMVIAEAAAMGTPAIISNIPGPTDVVIPDKTALLCEAKNANSLAMKMKQIYDNRNIIPEMSELCVKHISNNFDSTELNRKIFKRKENLLNTLNY